MRSCSSGRTCISLSFVPEPSEFVDCHCIGLAASEHLQKFCMYNHMSYTHPSALRQISAVPFPGISGFRNPIIVYGMCKVDFSCHASRLLTDLGSSH